MGKAADRLKATMGISVESKTPADQLYSTTPKTAPGKLVLAHQEARAYKQEAEALKNKMVRLSELHEVAGRKRTLSPEAFEELKANLANNPLANSIVVRARKEGGFEVISGHNRAQAYRDLGRTEIEADVREFAEEEVYEVAFYSNLINSPLTDFEKYIGFKNIQYRTNETHEQMARRAGTSKSQITSIFNFDKLPKQAIELISQNPHCIGYNAVSKIVAKDNSSINNQSIIKAVEKLINGEITESMAVTLSLVKKKNENRATVMAPVKKGGACFAEFTIRKDRMVIDFKDPASSNALMEKIRLLIVEQVDLSG